MTTRNKRKLAALNKENCEEHLRSNLAQNSSAPRSQEDYITQVSEEIEGRVTKRLSKEFSRTENRILGALARLDDFLMNPLLPGYSGATPDPARGALRNNQGTNEDDSQNDPHPEAGLFHGQSTRNAGPEDERDRRLLLLAFFWEQRSSADRLLSINQLHVRSLLLAFRCRNWVLMGTNKTFHWLSSVVQQKPDGEFTLTKDPPR